MWNIEKEDSCEVWISNICVLKIQHSDNKCKIYVDYKGYNVIMPMEVWGFAEEIQDRKIQYDIEGKKGKFKALCYVVSEKDLKLFCDMVYFFLSENNLDRALNDAFKF